MDTKKVTKTNTKAQEAGEIVHGENWELNHNKYVKVQKPNGEVVTGCKVEKQDDDLMNW